MVPHTISERATLFWLGLTGSILVAGFAVLSAYSGRFGYAVEVIDMPILAMVGILSVMGLAFLGAAYLVVQAEATEASSGHLFLLVLLVGVVARLVLVPSTPLLEDDYQRYLWDGAVTVQGFNPFAVAPEKAAADPALKMLVDKAGVVHERINYPEIRTVYPPGAQAFFALAHVIKPFSLGAWRTVVLVMDGVTFVLVLAVLRVAGRPAIWSALYWWNPIVIKELANSVHMEAVLMPFVLGAVLLAVRRRPFLATLALGIGAGIKIWPLALFPLVMRAATGRIRVVVASAVLLAGVVALWAAPMVLAGIDQSAGVVAYAERWRTNSAFFVVLLWLVEASGLPSLFGVSPNGVARGIIVTIVVAAGLLVAWWPVKSVLDSITRAMVLVVVIFLVSPAQFPWYMIWIAPFLAVVPVPGLLLLVVTMPLYYVAFYLMPRDQYELFNEIVIWCVWCPVWAALLVQGILSGPARRGRERATLTGR